MFINKLRQSVKPIMVLICNHPFNEQLANGTLSPKKLKRFLKQDSFYLIDYADALERVAHELPDPHHGNIFRKFANETIASERDIHKEYTLPLAQEKSAACVEYTQYLLSTAYAPNKPIAEKVASLVPCILIYNVLGKQASENKTENNPYQKWIDLYSNDEYSASADLAIEVLNDLGTTASAETKIKMFAAFQRATQLELAFFDDAYYNQKVMWPQSETPDSPSNETQPTDPTLARTLQSK